MEQEITESIWDGKDNVIPMAEVSHVEKHNHPDVVGNITVVFKHSKWVNEHNSFEPNVYLSKEQASDFMKCWCRYRNECESLNLLP